MSLEESMNALAESNLKLAKSFDGYAAVITKFGLKIEDDNAGKTTAKAKPAAEDDDDDSAKPAAKPKGRPPGSGKAKTEDEPKPKAKPKADDLDDDDDDVPDYDEVKAKLMSVKAAAGDKQPCLDIIGKFGYDTLGEVQGNEKDYAKILAACNKWLKANAD